MEVGCMAICTRCLGKLLPGDPRVHCAACTADYHDACGAEPCVAKACSSGLDPERRRALAVVLPALFASLTYVLGLLQVFLLNTEAKTVTIFASGMIGGPVCGLLTGTLACLLHQLLNPLGAMDLLGSSCQALAWALIGFTGGMITRRARALTYATLGCLLTFGYHVVTDWAGGLVSGLGFRAYFVGGFIPWPFTPIHIATNAALFAVVVPALIPAADRCRRLLR